MNKTSYIEKALECKGWTDKKKLALIYELLQKTSPLQGDILEIGSAWGRSTVLMALSSKKQVYSIDPHTGGLLAIQENKPQNSFDEFCNNLKLNNVFNKVNIIKNTSYQVYKNNLLPDDIKFSLAFIDGLHTAEAVNIDFKIALQHLVDNGVIIFDDYFEPSIPDYTKMINDIAEHNNFSLIKDKDTKLVYLIKE